MKTLNRANDGAIFIINHFEAVGFVIKRGGKFVLIRGARVLARTTPSMPQCHFDHRDRCLKDGSLVKDKNPDLYHVARDIEFESASAVACFVEAMSDNGHRCLAQIDRRELLQALDGANDRDN